MEQNNEEIVENTIENVKNKHIENGSKKINSYPEKYF